jgi:uncharacterized protein (UPF0212 family)
VSVALHAILHLTHALARHVLARVERELDFRNWCPYCGDRQDAVRWRRWGLRECPNCGTRWTCDPYHGGTTWDSSATS